MSTSHATLSAAADDRKARLAKLRNLKRKQPDDETVAPESAHSPSPPEEPDVTKRYLSGRNYDVEAKGPKLGFEAPPTQKLEGPTLEQEAAEIEAEIRRKAAEEKAEGDKGIDLFKLQPKKPNWDLKRDLEKKLEILNVRTDNAIAKLVRERIASAKSVQEQKNVASGNGEGEAVGLDGVALVEGLRQRERENEEDEKRDQEDELLA